ncbi:MAG: hypothetical protein DHS20C16_15900 [Phycisphaerae bacterium]|nr:MAG: hypothetical protein DHS20C16_15900 [Phycisphaerae bacterium]
MVGDAAMSQKHEAWSRRSLDEALRFCLNLSLPVTFQTWIHSIESAREPVSLMALIGSRKDAGLVVRLSTRTERGRSELTLGPNGQRDIVKTLRCDGQ